MCLTSNKSRTNVYNFVFFFFWDSSFYSKSGYEKERWICNCSACVDCVKSEGPGPQSKIEWDFGTDDGQGRPSWVLGHTMVHL